MQQASEPGKTEQQIWSILHQCNIEQGGECQAGMIFCVESYVGSAGGGEGVKLEQQILVTDSGYELLSDMNFDESLVEGCWQVNKIGCEVPGT
jgi:hypothetical protein